MAKEINFLATKNFQLKVTLKHIKPLIWRRILVASNLKLSDLHKIIQTSMGWTNSHLHHFIIGGKVYSEPDEESYIDYIDYSNVFLNKVFMKENQKIIYEYDFGDGWEHQIELEKILDADSKDYPICLSGKKACPPEDCGGPYGYMELLKVISDPQNEEYEEMIEWLGDDFDPDFFDIEETNEMLKDEDFGCIALY